MKKFKYILLCIVLMLSLALVLTACSTSKGYHDVTEITDSGLTIVNQDGRIKLLNKKGKAIINNDSYSLSFLTPDTILETTKGKDQIVYNADGKVIISNFDNFTITGVSVREKTISEKHGSDIVNETVEAQYLLVTLKSSVNSGTYYRIYDTQGNVLLGFKPIPDTAITEGNITTEYKFKELSVTKSKYDSNTGNTTTTTEQVGFYTTATVISNVYSYKLYSYTLYDINYNEIAQKALPNINSGIPEDQELLIVEIGDILRILETDNTLNTVNVTALDTKTNRLLKYTCDENQFATNNVFTLGSDRYFAYITNDSLYQDDNIQQAHYINLDNPSKDYSCLTQNNLLYKNELIPSFNYDGTTKSLYSYSLVTGTKYDSASEYAMRRLNSQLYLQPHFDANLDRVVYAILDKNFKVITDNIEYSPTIGYVDQDNNVFFLAKKNGMQYYFQNDKVLYEISEEEAILSFDDNGILKTRNPITSQTGMIYLGSVRLNETDSEILYQAQSNDITIVKSNSTFYAFDTATKKIVKLGDIYGEGSFVTYNEYAVSSNGAGKAYAIKILLMPDDDNQKTTITVFLLHSRSLLVDGQLTTSYNLFNTFTEEGSFNKISAQLSFEDDKYLVAEKVDTHKHLYSSYVYLLTYNYTSPEVTMTLTNTFEHARVFDITGDYAVVDHIGEDYESIYSLKDNKELVPAIYDIQVISGDLALYTNNGYTYGVLKLTDKGYKVLEKAVFGLEAITIEPDGAFYVTATPDKNLVLRQTVKDNKGKAILKDVYLFEDAVSYITNNHIVDGKTNIVIKYQKTPDGKYFYHDTGFIVSADL